jgi:alpha-acetolactate decarboxylase
MTLDYVFYRIPSDGMPKEVQAIADDNYATTTFFEADNTFNT